jgi:hypothetical protein
MSLGQIPLKFILLRSHMVVVVALKVQLVVTFPRIVKRLWN